MNRNENTGWERLNLYPDELRAGDILRDRDFTITADPVEEGHMTILHGEYADGTPGIEIVARGTLLEVTR